METDDGSNCCSRNHQKLGESLTHFPDILGIEYFSGFFWLFSCLISVPHSAERCAKHCDLSGHAGS